MNIDTEENTSFSNSILSLTNTLKCINYQLNDPTNCNTISIDSLLSHLTEIMLSVENCQRTLVREKGSLLQMCEDMEHNGIVFYSANTETLKTDYLSVFDENECDLSKDDLRLIKNSYRQPLNTNPLDIINHLGVFEEWIGETIILNKQYNLSSMFYDQLLETMFMTKKILFSIKIIERFSLVDKPSIKAAAFRLFSSSLKLTNQEILSKIYARRSCKYRTKKNISNLHDHLNRNPPGRPQHRK